jgi:hypothetical protein
MKLKIFFYYLFLFLFKVSVFGGVSNPLTPDGLKECWELYTNEPDEFSSRNKVVLIEMIEFLDKRETEQRELTEEFIRARKLQIESKIKSEDKILQGLAGALGSILSIESTKEVEYAQEFLDNRKNQNEPIRRYDTYAEFKLALENSQLWRSHKLQDHDKSVFDYINEKRAYGDIVRDRNSKLTSPHTILLGFSYLSRNNFSLNDTELQSAQKNIEQIQNGKIQDIDLIFLVRLLARYHTQNTSENPPVSG